MVKMDELRLTMESVGAKSHIVDNATTYQLTLSQLQYILCIVEMRAANTRIDAVISQLTKRKG